MDKKTGKEEFIETQPKLGDRFENILPSHGLVPNPSWQMKVAGAASRDLINNPYGYRIESLDAEILGKENISLNAYNIEDNNFFKLRDITQLFNIGTNWDQETRSIIMDSSIDYIN